MTIRLLLTASIAPKNALVARANHQERLNDYQRALQQWLRSAKEFDIESITFVDNSGFDLSIFDWAHRESDVPLEFLSVAPVPIPSGIHYGLGELALILEALRQAKNLASGQSLIAKSTGRLFFPDLGRLVARLPEGIQFAGDGRRNLRRGRSAIPFIETQLLLFSRDFFLTHFTQRTDWFRPERGRTHLENLVYDVVRPRAGETVITRWPINCEPVGVGGNRIDYRSPARRALGVLRAASRRVPGQPWI